MTPEKLKQLAEFAFPFLGAKKINSGWQLINSFDDVSAIYIPFRIQEQELFEDRKNAPILAHLAKREMEKRGFQLEYNKFTTQGYQWWIHQAEIPPDVDLMSKEMMEYFERCKPKWQRHENEYIALWSAIEQAVGGEK